MRAPAVQLAYVTKIQYARNVKLAWAVNCYQHISHSSREHRSALRYHIDQALDIMDGYYATDTVTEVHLHSVHG